MTWIEILEIVGPILAAFAWVYARIDKKFDAFDRRFDNIDHRFETLEKKIDKRFDEVHSEIKEVKQDVKELQKAVHGLDIRLTRVEGYMAGYYFHDAKKNDSVGSKSS